MTMNMYYEGRVFRELLRDPKMDIYQILMLSFVVLGTAG